MRISAHLLTDMRPSHARAENLNKVREEVAFDKLRVQFGDAVDLQIKTDGR